MTLKDDKTFKEELARMGARDNRRFDQNEAKRVAVFQFVNFSHTI